jgi:hypothetical protein
VRRSPPGSPGASPGREMSTDCDPARSPQGGVMPCPLPLMESARVVGLL